jgi:phosphatidate cytidylyltransferase
VDEEQGSEREGDEQPPAGPEDGPALTFGDEPGATLPHWSDPPSGEFELGGDEVPGGSRLFPGLPDDPNLVDESDLAVFRSVPAAEEEAPTAAAEPPVPSPSPPPLPEAEAEVPDQASESPFAPGAESSLPPEEEEAVADPDPFDTAIGAVAPTVHDTGVLPTMAATPPPPTPEPDDSGLGDQFGDVDEDAAAWSDLGTSAPHWRQAAPDWSDDLGVGARDPESARIVFGDDDEPVPAPMTGDEWPPAEAASMAYGADHGQGRDVPTAVITGVGLAAVFLGLMWLGPGWVMILLTPLLVIAAAELFVSVRRVGYRPAVPLGLAAVAGLALGAYWRGVEAYPVVLGVFVIAGFLWYIVDSDGERPTPNLAITSLGVLWVGGLGSFAALMVDVPVSGTGLLFGAVVTTVAYDIGGFVIGRTTGQSRIAPHISPNKTWEGTIGGMIVAVLVSTVLLGFIGVSPWDRDTIDAVLLGVVVAVAAPLGDLAQSLVKRDLGVKDMGSLLPGHGGLMDRFDGMLFVLPAVYYLARLIVL